MGEKKRLAPQSCVVAVQAGTERSTCYKQLGARVVIAVGVHCIGEGMNVWEVTPPRLIVILKGILEGKWTKTLHMYTNYSLTDHSSLLDLKKTKQKTAYQPAFSCSELEDAISRALPIPSVWIKRVLQESLSPDVIEEKRTLASTHSYDVLIETHWTDACTDRKTCQCKATQSTSTLPPFELSTLSVWILWNSAFISNQSTWQVLYHDEKYRHCSCYGYVWHTGRQSSSKLHTQQVWRWLI